MVTTPVKPAELPMTAAVAWILARLRPVPLAVLPAGVHVLG
jgi:hypothetical protein